MEVATAINERRSIRKYTPEPLTREEIEKILTAGMMAPSSSNLQPWYFVVIESKENMERLKDIMAIATNNLMPYFKSRFAKHPQVIADTSAFVRLLGGAPVCILAFLLKDNYTLRLSAIQSVAAAIENMLLTATDMNLGSCWLTAPLSGGVDDQIHAAFAPDKGELVAMVTLGHPDQAPAAPRRKDGRYTII
ncbi:nitroreductase family protein [uncultured Megasphaera sp.]|uniref:nitroreductase family protein n=1 Tax=uncultured Megasphaera sp. TaxID=165188 RepID=UPI002596E32E|nr:nitroreductase family protein [uncultured Megasphaera sp.]